jgi:hypothetical protein
MGLAQTTWYVDQGGTGDFIGIQQAIDHPNVLNNDTVIVRDGVYVENINFRDKSLTLTSENGPTLTVIDGNNSGSVVTFDNNSTSTGSTLNGFTLTNGSGTFDVSANTYCGGGVYCTSSSPNISNNIIKNNTSVFGGGVSVRSNSSPSLTGNLIENNSASAGGGISLSDSQAQISENTIIHNHATAGSGGGIASAYSLPTIEGNLIFGNSASSGGGGISGLVTSPVISGNTIVGNVASEGGGVRFYGDCYPVILDTILWGNQAAVGKEIWVGGDAWYFGYSILNISYSVVEGGQAGAYIETPGNDIIFGLGILSIDPIFISPPNEDFHLQPGSPCIDSGSPNSPLDPDGTRSDMGAFPFDQSAPLLSISNLVAGSTAQVNISNCTPGNSVFLVWSLAGGGPTSTIYGAGYVSPPFTVVRLSSNNSGQVSMTQSVPPQTSGTHIWFHGVDLGSATLLNPLAMTIQ